MRPSSPMTKAPSPAPASARARPLSSGAASISRGMAAIPGALRPARGQAERADLVAARDAHGAVGPAAVDADDAAAAPERPGGLQPRALFWLLPVRVSHGARLPARDSACGMPRRSRDFPA